MKRTIFILMMLLVAGSTSLLAQKFSNRGREFWTGYALHYFMEIGQNNSQQMVLYFSAEEAANVKVTTRGTTSTIVTNYAVPANSVIVSNPMPKSGTGDCRLYDVPPSFGGAGTDRLFDRSIHIESDVPIVAYAHISGAASSGATMLMPVESWGYSYIAVNSMQAVRSNPGGDGCFNWIFIVADHDNTAIEITPSVPLRNGNPAGVTFTAVLNRGQTYQIVGAAKNATTGYDLSGTRVRSISNAAGECYPTGVFSGSSLTAITCNGSSNGTADNLIQQVFPVQAWGKNYLTTPFSASTDATILNPSIYRVAVRDVATVVKKNGVQLTGLTSGSYYEYQSSTADLIEADKPVLVTQYMPSMNDGSNGPGCNYQGAGDPEMVYISPIEQAINRVGFYRNTEALVDVNYLTLVIPTAGVTSLKIDGSNTFSHTYPHPNKAGYTVVVQRWPAAKAQCIVQSDSAFNAITYGVGSYDSYAYNAGTMINNLNGTISLHNSEGAAGEEHAFTCRNSPVELSVLIAYQPTKLVWHLSQLVNMTPNADVIQATPVATGTVIVKGRTYYKYTLPGTFTFSQTGTFRFAVSSTHPDLDNCNNTEDLLLDVVVKDLGKIAAFDITQSGCFPDNVSFKWEPAYANGFTVNKWLWTFPDATTATTQQTTKLFNTTGLKDITLRITTQEGCIKDSLRRITVQAPAIMSIQATVPRVCETGTINFTAIAAPGTITVNGWYWDFGTGQTSTQQNPQNIVFAKYGTYTVKLVGKSGPDCITDTATFTVTVNARPTTTFMYPAGCLPVTGLVSFTSVAATPDGSALTGHTWSFGDANATPGNPNTAAIASPTHMYQTGTYDIRYEVTTQYGCKKDTLVHASFNPAPAMTYGALQPVCETANSLSVATAVITNGVPGTSIYKGPGVTDAGVFTPSQAGAGTHTIWYVFTTSGGCKDSVSATIVVRPAPQAAFTITPDVCLGFAVTLTDQSQPGAGSTLVSWTWDFGDNTTVTNNNGNGFTKTYTDAGNYTVSLTVRNDKGCDANKVFKATNVHPRPEVVFDLPTVVCMPKGEAAFTNRTTVAETTTLNYQWNFGDNTALSTTISPLHNYAAAGNYTVSLTATSGYGCTKTLSQPLSNFATQPIADFTIAPANICQGSDVTFTDASPPQSGTITSWAWNFGDGTTSAAKNPVKRFAKAGNFTTTLIVSNNAGCGSDAAMQPVLVHIQPVVNAGGDVFVAQGTLVTLNPTVNDPALTIAWTPAGELNNASILKPSYIASHDQEFTLTASDGLCTASDKVMVKILLPVQVPNAFTPNGDGINDTWIITNLNTYQGNTMEVFNRYGQQVYYSAGYGVPWDGRQKGNPLPVGVYYYIIDLKNGFGKLTGSVTIIR